MMGDRVRLRQQVNKDNQVVNIQPPAALGVMETLCDSLRQGGQPKRSIG